MERWIILLFDRYVLNVSFRTDGSNNFGSDEQFNPTWSAGAVWHVSEETFMGGCSSGIKPAVIAGCYRLYRKYQ